MVGVQDTTLHIDAVQIRRPEKKWAQQGSIPGNDMCIVAMERPFRIQKGFVEVANQVYDLEAKYRNIWSGKGRYIRENRKCFSVSWSQGEGHDRDYRVAVTPVKILKTEKCMKKKPGVGYWDQTICAGDVKKKKRESALLGSEDFGSPLVCLFFIKSSIVKPMRSFIPLVSGIIQDQVITNPIIYTQTAPFYWENRNIILNFHRTKSKAYPYPDNRLNLRNENSGNQLKIDILIEILLTILLLRE